MWSACWFFAVNLRGIQKSSIEAVKVLPKRFISNKLQQFIFLYFYEPVCSFDIQYKVSLPNTRHEMTNISPALYMQNKFCFVFQTQNKIPFAFTSGDRPTWLSQASGVCTAHVPLSKNNKIRAVRLIEGPTVIITGTLCQKRHQMFRGRILT